MITFSLFSRIGKTSVIETKNAKPFAKVTYLAGWNAEFGGRGGLKRDIRIPQFLCLLSFERK